MSYMVSRAAARFAAQLATVAGATLVGFNPSGAAAAGTVQDAIKRQVFLHAIPGIDATGATNAAAGINTAIAVAAAMGGATIIVQGRFRHASQIVVSKGVHFKGSGLTSDPSTGARSGSCFIKDFNGTGFLFSGDDSGTEGVQYDAIVGRTGDNVQVTGSRWRAPSIAVTNFQRDGVRIGATEAGVSSINANLWHIGYLIAVNPADGSNNPTTGRYGLNVDHTSTPQPGDEVNFVLGVPDCNGGFIGHADVRMVLQDCIRFGNTIDNFGGYLVAQHCGGYGFRFDAWARNNFIQKGYAEACATGTGLLAADSSQNVVWASRAVTLMPAWVDNGSGNAVFGHESTLGQDGHYNRTPWYWPEEFFVRAQGDSAPVGGAYIGVNALPARDFVEADGAHTKWRRTLYRLGAGEVNTWTDTQAAHFAHSVPIFLGNDTDSPCVRWGFGTPEGNVAGARGDLFLRKNGGAATCLYIKESDAGMTGWVAK